MNQSNKLVMNPKKFNLAVIIALLLYVLLVVICGCNFGRKLNKTEEKKDSVAVSSIDSNWLKKLIETQSNTKSSGSEIKIYGRDTTIFNTPINNYYPSANDGMYSNLIATISNWNHENQTHTKETTDSGSMAAKDSTHASAQAATKETETTARTPWYMWFMVAGLAWLLIKDFLPKIKIVKAS